MMTTSEKATQKSTTFSLRSVHHTSFLWALCHELVLSTTQRFVVLQAVKVCPFGRSLRAVRDSLDARG
jgi:ABC-type branched-subunit amino acid transport system permease subunit